MEKGKPNIYSSPFEARALNDVHLLALVGIAVLGIRKQTMCA